MRAARMVSRIASREGDATARAVDSSPAVACESRKNPRPAPWRPRRSRLITLCTIAATFVVCTGCVPKPLAKRPAYYGPTDTLPALVDKLNARNGRIDTLWAKGSFSADLVDPQSRDRTSGSGDLNLLFSRPARLRLAGRVLTERVFDIGSNDERYWMTLPQQDTMYTGTHEAAGGGRGGASRLPIRPDLLVEVLGVTPLATDLLKEPAPALRFNNDQDCYMLTWQVLLRDRFAVQKEVWYDRETLQPRLVLLFDDNGRVVLRAYPSTPQRVDGYDPPLELPTTYDLLFPDTGSTFVIRLRELERERDGAPGAGTFAYPGDRAKVSKVVDLDR